MIIVGSCWICSMVNDGLQEGFSGVLQFTWWLKSPFSNSQERFTTSIWFLGASFWCFFSSIDWMASHAIATNDYNFPYEKQLVLGMLNLPLPDFVFCLKKCSYALIFEWSNSEPPQNEFVTSQWFLDSSFGADQRYVIRWPQWMKQFQISYSWEYVPCEHIPVSVLRIYVSVLYETVAELIL